MCNAYCCCANTQISGLIRLLFIFTIINLIISFAAIFIRAAGTNRYKIALTYLESMNNGTFNYSEYNDNDDCKKMDIYSKIISIVI